MKNLIRIIAGLLFVSACTPKTMENNTHSEAPVYGQTPEVSFLAVPGIDAAKAMYEENRRLVDTETESSTLKAIANLEVYVLNRENLKNPELNFQGQLHPTYRSLINLHGYALSVAISKGYTQETLSGHLKAYKDTIFTNCKIENADCPLAAPFKGPYGAQILSHIMKQEVGRVSTIAQNKKLDMQTLKNIIFGLYVLKNFNESHSTKASELFLSFSSIFFNNTKTDNITDPLLLKYLTDLQNVMLTQIEADPNGSSCAIFSEISREKITEISTTLNSRFVTQLTNHYYRCHSPEQVFERLQEDEKQRKETAEKEIEEKGDWTEFRKDIHSRAYVLKKNHSKVLSNFGVQGEISLPVLYLMDQLYYGNLDASEIDTVLERFSEEMLAQFVEQAEQYIQMNFLYTMQYTFQLFNKALKESFETNGAINKEFVQLVYDKLWDQSGNTWNKHKEHMSQFSLGLAEVYFKLSDENKDRLAETYNDLKDVKLNTSSLTNLINLTVTYPIVLATTYFAGENGGGVMSIRVTWGRGTDTTLDIATVRPLKDFFISPQYNILQLLDFGNLGYQPREFERNIGLAAAIKTGFFDTVNLDLGKENQGLRHNLALFFKRYVEDNDERTEAAQEQIEKLRKIKDENWRKVQRFCSQPISGFRRLDLASVKSDFYLDAKEATSSSGKKDLSYVSSVLDFRTSVDLLDSEINKIKRLYQVLLGALEDAGERTSDIKMRFQEEVIPQFSAQQRILSQMNDLLKDLKQDNENCLLTLTKMQMFQQNIMQKQSVDYLAKVHAAMTLLSPTRLNPVVDQIDTSREANEIASQLISNLRQEQSKTSDPYEKDLIASLTQSSVLKDVMSQLGHGPKKALEKALNLMLLPHNYDGDDDMGYQYRISGMTTRARSLDDSNSFLNPRGGFNEDTFIMSRHDQEMRAREEILHLQARASELETYFAGMPSIQKEIEKQRKQKNLGTSEDFWVELNPNLRIQIETFSIYKDRYKSTEARSEMHYQADRDAFIIDGLEKMLGRNHSRLFYWANLSWSGNPYDQMIKEDLANYKKGPIYIPTQLSKQGGNLSCMLDASFEELDDRQNCQRFAIDAKKVVDNFVEQAQFYHLTEGEISPILRYDEEGDLTPLSALANRTLLNSVNIEYYDPSAILSGFDYYQYKDEINKWTWFDHFLARKFTVFVGLDGEKQVVNVPMLPGTYMYQMFYEQSVNGRFNDHFLQLGKKTEDVFRNFYRSEIQKSIRLTEDIIEQIVKREYTTKETDYPQISLQRKDIADTGSDNLREWVSLEIKSRNNGSLILLGDKNYEVDQFTTQQKTVFKDYNCTLLPKKGDSDHSAELSAWIEKSTSCPLKVRRWLQFKECEKATARAKKFDSYSAQCAAGLGE